MRLQQQCMRMKSHQEHFKFYFDNGLNVVHLFKIKLISYGSVLSQLSNGLSQHAEVIHDKKG